MALSRKALSIITSVALLVSLCAISSSAAKPENAGARLMSQPPITAREGFGNFIYNNSYRPGQFTDVPDDEWYAGHLADAFNYSLIQGKSSALFDPAGIITLDEAVALAAKLNSIYCTGTSEFELTEPYYMAYALYALEHGILAGHMDYGAPATRAQLAGILYNALPGGVPSDQHNN